MAEQEEDTKDVIDTKISVKVASQDGNEVYFKIRRDTPMSKMITAYCERQSTDPNAVRFLYDGTRILDTDTAISLGLEDEDVLDAVLQQTGGT